MQDENFPIYQLHIALLGTSPLMWRRIETRSDITLVELHQIVHAAMGWKWSAKSYQFIVRGKKAAQDRFYASDVTEGRLGEKSSDTLLHTALAGRERRMAYEFVISGRWISEITLEGRLDEVSHRRYPCCVAGAGQCPPNFLNNSQHYSELLRIIKNPNHPGFHNALKTLRVSHAGEYDPEKFDLQQANADLRTPRAERLAQRSESRGSPEFKSNIGAPDSAVLQLISYEITFEPLDEGSPPVTAELAQRYDELCPSGHDEDHWPALQTELEQVHEKFPEDAKIANYLAGIYSRIGRPEDSKRIVERQYRLHPDYLFARASWIKLLLHDHKIEEARSVLDGKFELSLMYPHRKIFHATEFAAFYDMIIAYHLAMGRLEEAEKALALLKKLLPDHWSISGHEKHLMWAQSIGVLKEMLARPGKRQKRKSIASPSPQLPSHGTNMPLPG